ncbi:GNAT family N-acetyltransferase [Halomarina oriensis]|uniref:GNAT family N-acetyltransferase n=1 Tax=Halomarina oriensis TaxID=671145 RepID=A0A6B0GTP2_9EURY|nr:GNAT family N-acetyltransferase [Halomarina oriensis]
MSTSIDLRQVRPDDKEAVVAFTQDTWAERGGSDYIPTVFDDWIAGDGERQRTFVLDVDDGEDVAGICQGVLLSDEEAWAQGMRVNPDYRGHGVSLDLTHGLFRWAADAGATVCRNMVFSWNVAGLGQSRASGFDAATEFRWAHPTPDADAESDHEVTTDPAAAWRCWQDSHARDHLRGLALDMDESWAVSELTRDRLHRAADETTTVAVHDEGARAMAFRTRTYERPNDEGESVRWAEYGVGAWEHVDHARSLFAAIARDAASVDADETRVLIPETVHHVTDVAYARAGISDEPDFVMAADLTDW